MRHNRTLARATIGALALLAGSAQAATGLDGKFYSFPVNNASVPRTLAHTQMLINAAGSPTATFTATQLCAPNCYSAGRNNSAYMDAKTLVGSNNFVGTNTNHVYLSAIEMTGFITFATTASHLFELYTDDGTSLSIDGVNVVTQDFDHPMTDPERATVRYTAGSHSVRLLHFEDGGLTGFKLFVDQQPANALNLSNTPTGAGAVPEPSSWALMIGGFGLIGVLRRRARQERCVA